MYGTIAGFGIIWDHDIAKYLEAHTVVITGLEPGLTEP